MNFTDTITVYSKSFPSRKETRYKIINALLESIKSSNLSIEQDDRELYLVVDEALTNAMEHGNHWIPRKKVHVKAELGQNFLLIIIQDEGGGFDVKHIVNESPARGISGRGRGITLIRQFCTPSWNAKGNEITLHIQLKKNSAN